MEETCDVDVEEFIVGVVDVLVCLSWGVGSVNDSNNESNSQFR